GRSGLLRATTTRRSGTTSDHRRYVGGDRPVARPCAARGSEVAPDRDRRRPVWPAGDLLPGDPSGGSRSTGVGLAPAAPRGPAPRLPARSLVHPRRSGAYLLRLPASWPHGPQLSGLFRRPARLGAGWHPPP